ncbi:hypothetical protein MIR68_006167 [Amoeboaphelidium protococcarum]|nr:hypothetical protein MIR68_006167 [Amoeboaphelidium protococcarum]
MNKLQLIKKCLPATQFDAIVAYGSGVFNQHGGLVPRSKSERRSKASNNHQTTNNEGEKKMIDYIVAVPDTKSFHKLNLQKNASHYSSIARSLSPRVLSYLTDQVGGGIYYNTGIPFEQETLKYGVISTSMLVSDLTNWDTLYVAGRLQKPVLFESNSQEVLSAYKQNLNSALTVAVLMMPQTVFTKQELFTQICQLSYMGDFRMYFKAEDPKKIHNIVSNQYQQFEELYLETIKSSPLLSQSTQNGEQLLMRVDKDDTAIKDALLSLPQNLKAGKAPLNDYSQLASYLRKRIISISRDPAITQAVKGVLTAGATKSFNYALRKIQKAYQKQ